MWRCVCGRGARGVRGCSGSIEGGELRRGGMRGDATRVAGFDGRGFCFRAWCVSHANGFGYPAMSLESQQHIGITPARKLL